MNNSTKTLPPWVAGLPGDKNHRPLSDPAAEQAAEQTPEEPGREILTKEDLAEMAQATSQLSESLDQLSGKIKALSDMIWQELN